MVSDDIEYQGSVAKQAERPSETERVKHEVVKKQKMIAVRVVRKYGDSAMVEVKTKDEWYRAVVPLSAVKDNVVAEEDLSAGKYGEDWAALVRNNEFAERLNTALRQRGIFSFADLRTNGPVAKGAILEAAQLDYLSLLSKEK